MQRKGPAGWFMEQLEGFLSIPLYYLFCDSGD